MKERIKKGHDVSVWRAVLQVLLCILLSFAVVKENVKAEIVCNVSCPSFSFVDTDGNTVTKDSIKGKATILIFSQAGCANTIRTINAIGRSDWFPNKNVNLVFGLFDGTEETIKEFQNTYCYNGMTFCYTQDSSVMAQTAFSCLYQAGGTGDSVYTPLVFVLDMGGNIRYESEGFISDDMIAAILDDYVSLDYPIEDENISISLWLPNDLVYTGEPFEPAVSVIKQTQQLRLTEGKDYQVSYENNTDAGTAAAVVTGLGYMKGSRRVEFTIRQRNLSDAVIAHIAQQTYTGNAVTPKMQVSCAGKTLTQGKDYEVVYSDNVNPGKATVQIMGIGNYTGSKTAGFIIQASQNQTAPITSFTVNQQQYKITDSTSKQVACVGTADKKKVTVPEYVEYAGVKYRVTSVAAKSFRNNKKVTQISIASSITKIGDSCFEGCTNLKSVTIGKSLRTIGKNAFKNCKKLTKITIKSTKLKTVGKNALKGINVKCKIKVPGKQLKKYQKLFKKKGQKSSVKVVK